MEDDGRIEDHRRKRTDLARVPDPVVVWSGRYAKGILLQAYLECLSLACHYKQKETGPPSTLRSELVKCLSAKSNVPLADEVKTVCLSLWRTLSRSLVECTGESSLSDESAVVQLAGYEGVLRLALLADFYSFQKQVLYFDQEQAEHKLGLVTVEALKFLASRGWCGTPPPGLHRPPPIEQPERAAGNTAPRANATKGHRDAQDISFRTAEPVYRGADYRDRRTNELHEDRGHEEASLIKWSKLVYSATRKSYHTKLINAFQVVKTLGHPTLTLASEWELSCYYKLALAYTTDTPLETAAGCIPKLRESVEAFHLERFQRLRQLPPESQMLLYAVLNCHINWVDHNHKQILLIPGAPTPSVQPRVEGDLRCSKCLKNQTFHSSEVKGNPRNIDVEYDFECMSFGSSCCAAPMFNVPLSTRDVNTCTFTEMKQMYIACPKCTQPIFSEVLVDIETLYPQCVSCQTLARAPKTWPQRWKLTTP